MSALKSALLTKRSRSPPKSALSQGRRRVDKSNEMDPSPSEKEEFWGYVQSDMVGSVLEFCLNRPGLMAFWRDFECDFQPFLLRYANVGTGLVSTGAIAVFYLIGFGLPVGTTSVFLQDLFGSLQVCTALAPHMKAIFARLDRDIWIVSGLHERVLVAAADRQNAQAFQHFNPKGSKRFLLDSVQPPREATLIQAVVKWQDPKLRREFLVDCLTKSSTAYVIHSIVRSGDATYRSALAEAAVLPDPECVNLLLRRLKDDGVIEQCSTAIHTATLASLNAQAACNSRHPDVHRRFAEVQVHLLAFLDSTGLARLRTHMALLRRNAAAVRSAHATTPGCAMYVQATALLGILAKMSAACRGSASTAMLNATAAVLLEESNTEGEEVAFLQRYEQAWGLLESGARLQQEVSSLREQAAAMHALLRLQTDVMKTVHVQTAVIARLRADAVARPAEFAEAQEELERLVSLQFIEDMETRLLALRMPDAPGVVCPTLELRALALVLPGTPCTVPVSLALSVTGLPP